MTVKSNLIRFIVSFLLCQAAGVIGSFFTAPAIATWYAYLQKPSFSPPNWVFAPVWLTLYTLMAVALFLVWRSGLHEKNRRLAIRLFLIHLFFNAIWSILFFGLRNPLLGLIDIVILWLLIAAVGFRFYRVSKLAAWLLLPYFLWVSLASALNFFIWRLN